jgi:hypothetical protein
MDLHHPSRLPAPVISALGTQNPRELTKEATIRRLVLGDEEQPKTSRKSE